MCVAGPPGTWLEPLRYTILGPEEEESVVYVGCVIRAISCVSSVQWIMGNVV